MAWMSDRVRPHHLKRCLLGGCTKQAEQLVMYPVSSYMLPTAIQLSTILQELPSLKFITVNSPKSQGAEKGPVKTDGLTVALLAERQAQQGRPLRRVQIELCRPGTRACKSSCAEINEVELLDRDPDENHLENHLLDAGRCSSPRTAPHSHVKEIGSTTRTAPTYVVIDIPRFAIALLFRPSDKRVYEAKATELTPTESENPFWVREVSFPRGIWSESCEQDPREASGPSEMEKIVVGDVTTITTQY
ncbi:hypothetical protein K443DRAFT_130443 [Laccaria amethystina LaAM-08-1]|uniref:Uncharacterized protein n=1 Tax=Laccaria amethystina LaAM-08-1 TaxID=1095629 RepID=A0A0C9X005_9AGAR|nr:hypothetical protein K443DRAFT_130443 [Laccaria amethystina LaAM-08-1]